MLGRIVAEDFRAGRTSSSAERDACQGDWRGAAHLHVVDLVGRPGDAARDPGVAPGPSGEILEVWSGLVFVTLEAVVQASVRLVVRLAGDPAGQTDKQTFLLGIEDVPLPDGGAGGGEAESGQAVPHQLVGDRAQHAAHPRAGGEVLPYVHTQILTQSS